MRSRTLLSALSLVVLLAACRDETNTGGGSEGGNPSDGGNGPSNGGGGNTPSNGGGGNGPSNGGGGEGAGAGPSNGGGGNGPQGGFGGQGGTAPQGGQGGGGAPPAGETDCIDNIDNDSDGDTDCQDSECLSKAVCGDLVINEIDYNNVGTGDSQEFLEIYNAGLAPVDLDGLSVYRINGSTGAPYGGASGIALTGSLDADSYLVIASATTVVDAGATVILFGSAIDNLQNGPDAVAIYDTAHQVLIDAFAYGGVQTDAAIDGLTFDLHEGAAAIAEDSNVLPISVIRFPNGADTNNADADWSTTTIITPGAENQQAAVPETNCSDGIDNNTNGDIDCDDADCDGLVCDANGSTCDTLLCACPGGTTESLCGDGSDNDCDGDIDCADSNCNGSPACAEDCDDGVDNNGDLLADCLDPLCAGQVCGANGLTCAANVCACPGGTVESICGDTLDNDCDGQTDCTDTDCAASCVPPVLFFSEYAEGTMTRKALEIYNNGGSQADLSTCTLNRYTNGASAPTASLALTGMLAAGDAYVLCNPSSVQPGDAGGIPAAQCDITNAFINHNGDDSYDLTCNGTMVDFFGRLTSGNFAADVTLRRNCSVVAGKTMTSTTFDASEWTSLPVNTFDGLNARSCPLNP